MKYLPIFLLVVTFAGSAWSQAGYEAQYPYDPYNPAPQPAQNYAGYQQHSKGGGGGGYSNGGDPYSKLLSYGSLEGHYSYNDFSGDEELKGEGGFGANLKVQLMKPLFLHFSLDRLTSQDAQARSIEITTGRVGGGLYLPVASRFHIFGEIGFAYDYTTGDLKEINTDEFAVYLRPGVRLAATDSLELSLSVLFNSTDNLNNRVIEGAAYYAIFDWFDIGLGVDVSEDTNSYHIGGRVRW